MKIISDNWLADIERDISGGIKKLSMISCLNKAAFLLPQLELGELMLSIG